MYFIVPSSLCDSCSQQSAINYSNFIIYLFISHIYPGLPSMLSALFSLEVLIMMIIYNETNDFSLKSHKNPPHTTPQKRQLMLQKPFHYQ